MRVLVPIISGLLWLSKTCLGVELDPDSLASVQNATALIAYGLMDYYNGLQKGETIGMFANPYYWWEAGGAWGSMLDYWFYMENDTYNDIISQALLYQTGDNHDYIPLNQSTTEGNDDQAFWGLAVMAAAERNFTNPNSTEPQWLYLAQAVFNTMALRWDTDTCGGGLRWQIFKWNSGYDYKNTVSNGALFHLAARLARYTGNQTYADWAEKVFDWMRGIKLITEGQYSFVYDGASVENNCTAITPLIWTYNQGLLMSGSAYLYNMTGNETWHSRTQEFLNSSVIFFNNSVLFESACQGKTSVSCNNDQRSFKAYFSRFLGLTAQLVPETRPQIMEWLETSAKGAAQSCSGGYDGHTCGLNWFYDGWDGWYGLGEQMAALEVMQNLRCLQRPAPYTATTGGSSIGNGAAGTEQAPTNLSPLDITAGSRAAAGIITAVIGLTIIAGSVWLIV
ncbi:LAMI_0C10726g1_1 [Lachancea mirantina]|uniref:Mannan endo-1,6-alpha-mannosidase n=1 Tax=Lachancea mirantina TaxID=1230905 RepID=A0A1G4J6S7_9SACH|nr:LAMI_0C10726g1_1 [Lachancea mirantina]